MQLTLFCSVLDLSGRPDTSRSPGTRCSDYSGGSGLGAAAARRLAADGFKVAILSSSGKGEALAAEWEGRRHRLQSIQRRPSAPRLISP